MLKIANLQREGLSLLEAVSGSHAYGLPRYNPMKTLKACINLPKTQFYGMAYVRR